MLFPIFLLFCFINPFVTSSVFFSHLNSLCLFVTEPEGAAVLEATEIDPMVLGVESLFSSSFIYTVTGGESEEVARKILRQSCRSAFYMDPRYRSRCDT